MQSRNEVQLEFLEQCMVGDECKVTNMLNANIVDTTYHHPINGWTALHWAARRGHESICLLLLRSGFSRELKESDGRTPWEVRRTSSFLLIYKPLYVLIEQTRDAVESNRFVPNYIRHPPFPYSKSSSFEYGTGVSRVLVSPCGAAYYSYGRRDSLNRTRFLLVRTCFSDGKEAFKRVTLPGGASLTQLKKIVEKSVQRGEIEAILTLPDRVRLLFLSTFVSINNRYYLIETFLND
uniref:ANK_REP_REGION domain-containing protein n=1 Tax=Angiostrongylus cantonensis TaxID=6313 RepID=A0A0K0CVG7_ANGCA